VNIDNIALAAAKGDKAAGEQIFKAFRPLIEAAASQRQLLPLGEDARSEAQLSLWLAVLSFDPALGIPFAGYAKAKVYNDLRTLFNRERHRWQNEVLPEQLQEEGDQSFFAALVDRHDGTREFIAEHELLDNLTERQRLAVKLLYLEDLPQKEVAKRLGIKQAALSRLVKRTLQKLRAEAG